MKKMLIFGILAILSITCFGQINFEKGYFIDNQNQKIDCFIKNSDWLKNPTSFKYRLTEDGELQSADISNVKEFCIPNSFKFIRATVAIDISPSELKNLSDNKNPIWENKQLFLKMLVEGSATLYYYYDDEIDERFFYSSKDSAITQLVYKEYIHDIDHTAINDSFRIQLRNNVHCSFADDLALSNITYKKSDLVNYFVNFNTCFDPSFKVPQKKHNKGEFSIAVLAGLSYSSITIAQDSRTFINTNFNKQFINCISTELEYTLPFNNSKWGIVVSPTYQSNYHSENNDDFRSTMIDFESIDLAVGIKYYLFLTPKAKLFFDCSINSIWSHPINSKIGYKVNTSRDYSYLPINEMYNNNFIVGVGFEYKRIISELKYFSTQNILSRYGSWDSDLEKVSLSIGYKFLKTKKNE